MHLFRQHKAQLKARKPNRVCELFLFWRKHSRATFSTKTARLCCYLHTLWPYLHILWLVYMQITHFSENINAIIAHLSTTIRCDLSHFSEQAVSTIRIDKNKFLWIRSKNRIADKSFYRNSRKTFCLSQVFRSYIFPPNKRNAGFPPALSPCAPCPTVNITNRPFHCRFR